VVAVIKPVDRRKEASASFLKKRSKKLL
jgi:hypothetical protein